MRDLSQSLSYQTYGEPPIYTAGPVKSTPAFYKASLESTTSGGLISGL